MNRETSCFSLCFKCMKRKLEEKPYVSLMKTPFVEAYSKESNMGRSTII